MKVYVGGSVLRGIVVSSIYCLLMLCRCMEGRHFLSFVVLLSNDNEDFIPSYIYSFIHAHLKVLESSPPVHLERLQCILAWF